MVLTKFKTQKSKNKIQSVFCAFFIFSLFISSTSFSASATGEKGMVVTQHPLATEAALEILKKGGSAADAAITAQLVLNVVEPQGSGLGGGGFFLYYDRVQRSVTSYDGRESAPASANPEMFLRNGIPMPFFPDRMSGGLAVGVPGTPALIQKIYDKHGSGVFSLAQLAEPAVKVAEEGFPVSKTLAEKLIQHADRLRQFSETEKIFFNQGVPLKEGETLVQKDLAQTLKLLGEKKAEVFYRGEVADAVAQAVQSSPVNSAVLTKSDLENYAVIKRDPVYGNYRGLDILAPALPTAGGITLIQALQILQNFDISDLGWDSQALHFVNEAQKIAFAGRARLGDAELKNISVEKLLSKEHAQEAAKKIQPQKALRASAMILEEGMQTTHISIVDRAGNLVSWTSTIEAPFGSGITVPGYGFLLNNELTDFDAEPYDAQGNLKPNAAQPAKRPLSSMTPVFLFNKGNPFMIVGSPGGTTIIGSVLNVIVNAVDFAMPCEEAVAKERMIFRGQKIEMEPAIFNHPFIRLQLELWSHDVEKAEVIGNVQAICFDARYQQVVGVSDPRGEGSASGF